MLNKTVLMGRLTKDPELKRTPYGVPVTSFSLAVQRNFKDKQTGERPVDFFDVVAWRNTAEYICRYFSKGRMMVVEGSLQTRLWTDKNGANRKSVELAAESAYFVGDGKREDGGQGQTGYRQGGCGGYGYGYGGYGAAPPPAQNSASSPQPSANPGGGSGCYGDENFEDGALPF